MSGALGRRRAAALRRRFGAPAGGAGRRGADPIGLGAAQAGAGGAQGTAQAAQLGERGDGGAGQGCCQQARGCGTRGQREGLHGGQASRQAGAAGRCDFNRREGAARGSLKVCHGDRDRMQY